MNSGVSRPDGKTLLRSPAATAATSASLAGRQQSERAVAAVGGLLVKP